MVYSFEGGVKEERKNKYGLLYTIAISAIFVILFGVFSQAGATAATTVVVTPTNTQGWAETDTRTGGDVNFITDSTSPLPSGALQLTTDTTNAAKANYVKSTTTPLADISELSYSTKQVSGPPEAAASYQMEVLLNGASGGYTTLVYEPYNNGPITPTIWQNWDVDQGLFWSTKTVAPLVIGTSGGPATYTLAQLKSAYPNAIVTSFGVNIGSYNPNYNVETDAFDFNGTTYDFEVAGPAAAVPTGLTWTSPNVPCGGETTSSMITANWNDSVNAVAYEYTVTTPGAHNSTNPYVTTTSSSEYSGVFNEGYGIYTYSVKAVNSDGVKSASSAACSITFKAPQPIKAINKDQCKNDNWKVFTTGYKNQGDCVSSVVSNKNS